MPKFPPVSIIVPCKEINQQVQECIRACLMLDYPDFEILLLPDKQPHGATLPAMGLPSDPRVHVIPTGPVKPSAKRNRAVELAVGEIYAFLDADAYPTPDWLQRAISCFEPDHVDGVGGPNLTPPHQTFMEEVGGDVLASTLCSGPFALRYKRARRESFQQELPACNLLVRKLTFERLGGFDTTFMTAEDSKLCFQISDTGHKVLYSPDVIVYHYRRPLFIPHLMQISRYARDKARLIEQGPCPEAPRLSPRPEGFSWGRLIYVVPSLFVLGLILGPILGAVFPALYTLFVGTLFLYVALIVASYVFEIRKWSLIHFLLFAAAIPLTHIVYGISFMRGLLARECDRGA